MKEEEEWRLAGLTDIIDRYIQTLQ